MMHEMSMCANLYTLIQIRRNMMRTSIHGEAARPNNAELMTEDNIEKVSLWLDSLTWKEMIEVLHSLLCNMTSDVFARTLGHLTNHSHMHYYIVDQWFGDFIIDPKTDKITMGTKNDFDAIQFMYQMKKWTNQSSTPDLLPALLIEAAYYGGNHDLEAAGVYGGEN